MRRKRGRPIWILQRLWRSERRAYAAGVVVAGGVAFVALAIGEDGRALMVTWLRSLF